MIPKYFQRLELLITLSLVPLFACGQTPMQLFNQRNLQGWYAYEPETGRHSDPSEIFSVENNMIRLYGSKAGYLMSKQSFVNFKLTVEYRWNTDTTFIRKNNRINSGVMYLVPPDIPDTLWPKGIQFQIKEGASGDFILLKGVTININGQKTEPGKSVVASRFKDAAKPVGDWNTLVVIVKKGNIKQYLNDELVNEGNSPSVTEGRILLQYEGFPIDFRKVEILKL